MGYWKVIGDRKAPTQIGVRTEKRPRLWEWSSAWIVANSSPTPILGYFRFAGDTPAITAYGR
jgi:hypothetical protein